MILNNHSQILVCEDSEEKPSETCKCLTALKLEHAIFVNDFNGAKEAIEMTQFQLVIVHLRMQSHGGVNIIQMIKNHNSDLISNIPIIVICPPLTVEDTHFLKDMDIKNHLIKPFSQDDLGPLILKSLREQDVGSSHDNTDLLDNDQIVRMVSNAIRCGKDIETSKLAVLNNLKKDTKSPRLLTLLAEILYTQSHINESKDLVEKILSANCDYIHALNLKSKICVSLGRFHEALKLMERAHTLSPLNTQRLLAMAEINLANNRYRVAEEKFKRALAIHPDLELAKIGLARSYLERNNPLAKEIIDQISDPNIITSEMNLKGVVLSKSGLYKQAISIYEKARSCSLSERHSILIEYNIALAKFKNGDFHQSNKNLEHILSVDPNFEKAKRLKIKISKIKKELLSEDEEIVKKEEIPDSESKYVLTESQIQFLLGKNHPNKDKANENDGHEHQNQ